MRQFYYELRFQERYKETRCDTFLCGHASNTTENCGAVRASVFWNPSPVLTRVPFQTLKYTKTCTVYTL